MAPRPGLLVNLQTERRRRLKLAQESPLGPFHGKISFKMRKEPTEAAPEVMEDKEPAADESLNSRIQELETQLAEARDGMLRAIADLQNYRRRAAQEIHHARELGAAALAEKLLPALDNFERTLAAAESGASAEAVLDGIRLVDKQIHSALEHSHVRPIHAVGKHFDPHLHEAVVSEQHDSEEGTIIEELERGYTLGKRVLRPTKARVSKGPEK